MILNCLCLQTAASICNPYQGVSKQPPVFVKPKAEFVCCSVRGAEDTPGVFAAVLLCGFQQDVGVSLPLWPAQPQRSFPSQHFHITFQSTAMERTSKSVCSSSQSTFEDKFTVLGKKNPLKYKIFRLIRGLCLFFLFYPSLPPPFIKGPNWCKWTSEGVTTPSI